MSGAEPAHPDPDWLLALLPDEYRGEVAGMLAHIGMKRLPPMTVGLAVPGGYLLQVDRFRRTILDASPQGVRNRRLTEVGNALKSARGAEIREAMIAIDGRPPLDPQAWAWRCAQILRDALALSGMRPAEMLERMSWSSASPNAMPIDVYAPYAGRGPRGVIASLIVALPPAGDRLRTTLSLGAGVVYRESPEPELALTKDRLPEHALMNVVGKHISHIYLHALLQRHEYVVRSAWVERSRTRVRFDMPELSLARLPRRLGDLLPHHDRSSLVDSPWSA